MVRRRVGVESRELGPADGQHLDRGVELHRAGAEWDHRGVEGEILRLEAVQVAEHLVFPAVAVEHRMAEEVAGPGEHGG